MLGVTVALASPSSLPPLTQTLATRRKPRRAQMSAQGSGANGAGPSIGAAVPGAAAPPQSVVLLPDGRLQQRTVLSSVVTDAIRRWYLETEKEALRGDVKSQALLGQMLIEGYGCDSNPEKGREWVERARRRGYRMQGVYCEI